VKTYHSYHSVNHLEGHSQLKPLRGPLKSILPVLAIALALGVSAAGAAEPQVIVQNLGVDIRLADTQGVSDGRFLTFRNVGGSPSPLLVYDTASDNFYNLGECDASFRMKNGLVVFGVPESYPSPRDLNGDGDTEDFVLHVLNAQTGVIRNSRLAVRLSFGGDIGYPDTIVNDHVIACLVSEIDQGGTDLNGNGLVEDHVLHLYDVASDTAMNLGFSPDDDYFHGLNIMNDRAVAFTVRETLQDLNGDGDTLDSVLHVHDTDTGVTTNVGICAESLLSGSRYLAFQVSESAQGNTDLNGDGDTLDSVIHIYDTSGGVSNLGIAGGISGTSSNFKTQVFDDPFVLRVNEFQQGTDLNSDGDTDDSIWHVYNANTDVLRNLASDFGYGGAIANGKLIAFGPPEAITALFDVARDTLLSFPSPVQLRVSGGLAYFQSWNEDELHIYDATTGGTTDVNIGQARILAADGTRLAFGSGESSTLRVYDHTTGAITDLGVNGYAGFNGSGLSIANGVLAFGSSLFQPNMLVIYDHASGSVVNTGLPVNVADGYPPTILGANNRVLFQVPEWPADLNGDGDTFDYVLHVAKVLPDTDGDGVSEYLEAGAANGGDGNNDGIADGQQDHVASLQNSGNGDYVTIASPTGESLANVTAISNPSPTDSPQGINFPIGFLKYEVHGVSPGSATIVTLFLPPGTPVDDFWKYGPEPGNPTPHWYQLLFNGTTGAELFTDRVVLHFIDGARGDDDLSANGVIVEPGGPATICPSAEVGITAPHDPVQVSTLLNASATFTGCCDPNTAIWHWGDGTTSAGTLQSGQIIGSHAYTRPGVYEVELTMANGGTGPCKGIFQFVVVYDPNGGYVTGGGWINSPLGAYAVNPALAGKANFGFVAKYKKGATIPEGNTEFQFKAGNLNFHSTSYDWLVVAGAKAKYKGSGEINGGGNYGFMLTTTDGQINGGGMDKFRLKIWDKNNGDGIVYDNQMGASDTDDPTTALGGGSIVIHKP